MPDQPTLLHRRGYRCYAFYFSWGKIGIRNQRHTYLQEAFSEYMLSVARTHPPAPSTAGVSVFPPTAQSEQKLAAWEAVRPVPISSFPPQAHHFSRLYPPGPEPSPYGNPCCPCRKDWARHAPRTSGMIFPTSP